MASITLHGTASRIGGVTKVHIHGFERICSNQKTAKTAVTWAISRQLKYSYTRVYRRAADDTMFVLYYSDGWYYDIIGPQHIKRGYPCTVSISGRDAYPTYAEALARMEQHVANYADNKVGDKAVA